MPEPIMFPTIRLTPLSSEISFLSCMLSLGGCMSWDESLALPFILLASSSAAMMPSSLDWASRNRGPAVDTTDPYPISGNLWNNLSNTFRRSIDFLVKWRSSPNCESEECVVTVYTSLMYQIGWKKGQKHRTEVWDEHERGRAVKVGWEITTLKYKSETFLSGDLMHHDAEGDSCGRGSCSNISYRTKKKSAWNVARELFYGSNGILS